MLKRLHLKGFTVFRNATEVDFSPGINVIIGENGYGKSHLLKLAYSLNWFSDVLAGKPAEHAEKSMRERLLGRKLVGVFRPDALGRLASRGIGRARAEVSVAYRDRPAAGFSFSFATNSKFDVVLGDGPKKPMAVPSVFLPTKEVMSMYPGFAALYRDYHMEIDETYYDLCLALERPLTKGPKAASSRPLLAPIERILGGRVVNENGRFFLKQPGRGNMEMPLVAEGFRKLATVAYLIANGSLRNKAALFWDEPEANLNARYIRAVADTLVAIAGNGVQVVIATHSLFLLREIELLLMAKDRSKIKIGRHFVALGGKPGEVTVTQADDISAIHPILALDEELAQNDRYLEASGQEGDQA